MKMDFDEKGLSLCKFQAGLFEKSVTATGGSSPFFIKCFMNSEEALHIDMDGFLSEAEDIESTLGKLKSKHNLERGSIKYSEDSLYWMGYLYRYWCYTYQAKSRSVYKIIQAEELHSLYLPYHTLDPGTAIQCFCNMRIHGLYLANDEVAESFITYSSCLFCKSGIGICR